MNKNSKFKIASGFTLIELLVVISIIGILAAMITVSFVSSQRQARDVNRKSDLAQYRTALENYANQNGDLYPVYPGGIDIDPLAYTTFCSLLGLTKCPSDPEFGPTGGNYFYKYYSDDGGTEYILYARLENAQSTTYWVVCSNGTSGPLTGAGQPTSGDCPLTN